MGFAIVSNDGKIIEVNNCLSRILGYKEDVFIDSYLKDFCNTFNIMA